MWPWSRLAQDRVNPQRGHGNPVNHRNGHTNEKLGE